MDAFDSHISLKELLSLSKAFRKGNVSFRHERSIRLGVLANHSTQFLVQGLELALLARGTQAQIFEAQFDQWEREIVERDSDLAKFNPDVVFLSLSSIWLAYREAASDIQGFAKLLADKLKDFQLRSRSRILLVEPEPLQEELESSSWASSWRRNLLVALERNLGSVAILVSIDSLIAKIGSADWYAGRYVVNGKFMFNPERTAAVADFLAKSINALIVRPTRLVVVDLDNTLWGGVVGELGAEGVDLDYHGKGYGHIRLQRFLLHLYEKGVLLAIASKNNESDALEVFRTRKEMLLKEHHFCAKEINWGPKSESVLRILKQLNLTETGTLFLDDSAFERGEVRNICRAVNVPEWSGDISELVPDLIETGMLCIPSASEEDMNRQQMYAEQAKRECEKRDVVNPESYYQALELKLTVKSLDQSNISRGGELFAKTNQFNLTLKRHSASALNEISKTGSVFLYSLDDKHGGYGIISAVALIRSGDLLEIDNWVMSCRAMGRTAERAIMEHLVDVARADGIKVLKGRFVFGPKNSPVEKLYDDLGFWVVSETESEKIYSIEVDKFLNENKWVQVLT